MATDTFYNDSKTDYMIQWLSGILGRSRSWVIREAIKTLFLKKGGRLKDVK